LGCHTPIYTKGDGFLACAILINKTLDFSEAEVECKNKSARLPQIYSTDEVDVLATLTVKIIF